MVKMLSKLISGFIVIMVGISLLPEFANPSNELISWTIDKEPQKPHRQTYLEYVQERLEVERLMKKY